MAASGQKLMPVALREYPNTMLVKRSDKDHQLDSYQSPFPDLPCLLFIPLFNSHLPFPDFISCSLSDFGGVHSTRLDSTLARAISH